MNPLEDAKPLSEVLKNIRMSSRITQAVLARKTGLTSNYVCLVEHGERGVSQEALEKIAASLGYKVGLVLVKDDTKIFAKFDGKKESKCRTLKNQNQPKKS